MLPDLAESWEFSNDGRTVKFKLRPGVKWHTGSPFTADDVVFTYNLLADPALGADPEQAQLWQTLRCNAPNDLTVLCELPEPFAPFLAYARVGILPSYLLQATNASTLTDDPFNRAPVGTGPYRLVALDDSQAELVANAEYHLGAPMMPEIVLRFFPDISSAAAAVVSGDADGILMDARRRRPRTRPWLRSGDSRPTARTAPRTRCCTSTTRPRRFRTPPSARRSPWQLTPASS